MRRSPPPPLLCSDTDMNAKVHPLLVLVLALSVVTSMACHKKKRVPTPNYFQRAEAYFRAGDYAQAARAYEAYLSHNPSPSIQDRALFRLALAHLFPQSAVHDPKRATEILHHLVTRFPESPYAPEAHLILGLQADVNNLRAYVNERLSEIQRLQNEVHNLRSELDARQSEARRLREDIDRLRQEVEMLRSELRAKENRLRELQNELEQLKRIDIERRPPRPPDSPRI